MPQAQEAQREIQQEQIRAWERQAEEHEFELELIRQLAELSEFDDAPFNHQLEDFHWCQYTMNIVVGASAGCGDSTPISLFVFH